MKYLFSLLVLFSAFSMFAQLPTYVPTNGLVGYWPFNGNANDVSGNGNNGTVNGATLTTDRFGVANKAYSFDPSLYQLINVGQNQLLNSLNQVTISTWFFPNSNASYSHLVNKSNDLNNHQFILSTNNNGIYFYYNNASSFFQTTTSPIQNQCNHIVVTYSFGSGSDNCKIYLNGNNIGNFVTTALLQTTIFNLKFGSFGNNNINTVKGKIDDIGIWNRALTQQEITNLNSSSVPPPTCNITTTDSTLCLGESTNLTSTAPSSTNAM